MKILLVCERLDGHGGWYTYARDLRDGLIGRKHTVVTCTCKDAREGDHPILPRPLPLMTGPWRAWGVARALAALCEREQPDVIHIVVEPYALAVPFLPACWRQKAILTVHGSYGIRPLLSWKTRLLAKAYYRRIPAFITVSAFTRRVVDRALGGAFAARATVVHNAVRLPPKAARGKRDHRILLVGGVKPRKGALEALEACAVYRAAHKQDIDFSIVGDADSHDAYVQAVRRRITELGLERQVRLIGRVADAELHRLYAGADLFLMPAGTSPHTFEGFGLTYLEAAAHGVPSIGPNDAGVPEAIKDGVSGYLVDPKDPRDIARRMHDILDKGSIDPAACRAWAEEHSIATLTKETIAAYARL